MSMEPPSGEWRGFYLESGARNQFTMQLSFSLVSQHFHGTCRDHQDNPVQLGCSDIRGTWSLGELGQAGMQFEKHYRRGHSVDYKGDFTLQENYTRVVGDYFDGADVFEMMFIAPEESKTKRPRQAKEAALFANVRKFYLAESQSGKNLADFSIECQGGEAIKAHRFLLASHSKFFEAFFRREAKNHLKLDEIEPVHMQACLDYMGTGEVQLEGGDFVQNVLEAANFLGMDCLLEECAEVICEKIELDNCIEVACLGTAVGSQLMVKTSEEFIVKHIEALQNRGLSSLRENSSADIFQLPLASFRAVLQSDDLVLHTSKGNIVPGGHREFHVLALAHRYIQAQEPQTDLQISSFLDCIRFGFYLSKTLTKPSLLMHYLKSKFEDYPELEDRAEVIASFCQLSPDCGLSWPVMPTARTRSQETFYLYDPRVRSLVRQGHQKFDQVSSDRGFDLSCEDFNQNIRSLKLFSQESGSMDLLKRISLTFCDGSEKTVATQVANHTSVHQLEVSSWPCHILLLSGPWVADPLEQLLALNFLLSDGSVVGFREETFSLDRTQSVLDFLPASVHAGNLRWVGLCGSVLDTSQCGDSVICNLMYKFSSLCDIQSEI